MALNNCAIAYNLESQLQQNRNGYLLQVCRSRKSESWCRKLFDQAGLGLKLSNVVFLPTQRTFMMSNFSCHTTKTFTTYVCIYISFVTSMGTAIMFRYRFSPISYSCLGLLCWHTPSYTYLTWNYMYMHVQGHDHSIGLEMGASMNWFYQLISRNFFVESSFYFYSCTANQYKIRAKGLHSSTHLYQMRTDLYQFFNYLSSQWSFTFAFVLFKSDNIKVPDYNNV